MLGDRIPRGLRNHDPRLLVFRRYENRHILESSVHIGARIIVSFGNGVKISSGENFQI